METPRYEYGESKIRERIKYLKSLSAPFGLTVRYAMKANPYPAIIRIMNETRVCFDASSSYEVVDLLAQGVTGNAISLSSQQTPHNLDTLLEQQVLFVATSLRQLKLFLSAKNHPSNVGVRINPDMGQGHNKRTSTGGVGASFGIWHEYIPELLKLTRQSQVIIDRLHIHIGSGADPSIWGAVMDRALTIVEQFPDVVFLDIGGGYKVHRYAEEPEADMVAIMQMFSERLQYFYERTGRKLHLEIEPGTYFIAHSGTLVATVDDIVDTGVNGFTFLRLNTGMNDFLRTALYGAQHEMEIMNVAEHKKDYVVVGHNCESGDIFTPAPGNPEEITTRTLHEASVGDEIRIYDVGAYGGSMRAKGYNAFPDAAEYIVE